MIFNILTSKRMMVRTMRNLPIEKSNIIILLMSSVYSNICYNRPIKRNYTQPTQLLLMSIYHVIIGHYFITITTSNLILIFHLRIQCKNSMRRILPFCSHQLLREEKGLMVSSPLVSSISWHDYLIQFANVDLFSPSYLLLGYQPV